MIGLVELDPELRDERHFESEGILIKYVFQLQKLSRSPHGVYSKGFTLEKVHGFPAFQ